MYTLSDVHHVEDKRETYEEMNQSTENTNCLWLKTFQTKTKNAKKGQTSRLKI